MPASKKSHEPRKNLLGRKAEKGTLGYGPAGLVPGTQGFGLEYHPGYGYGGRSLGVGAAGGDPAYGGPGYPHPAPCLRRIGKEAPFLFLGGPGGPSPAQPNFYGEVGPLSADPPVVTFQDDPGDSGYGIFTGVLPYPETTFTPATTMNALPGPDVATSPTTAPRDADPATRLASNSTNGPDPDRSLGVQAESSPDAGIAGGIRVTKVRPGSIAAQLGLVVGEVILSVNGHPADRPDFLAKIMKDQSPENFLRFRVRGADGRERTLVARHP